MVEVEGSEGSRQATVRGWWIVSSGFALWVLSDHSSGCTRQGVMLLLSQGRSWR